jgi:hypothetical protein
VTLFRFPIRPGQSIFDLVVYAAKKAFISGEFAPGQPFPSVRTLAAELKILRQAGEMTVLISAIDLLLIGCALSS